MRAFCLFALATLVGGEPHAQELRFQHLTTDDGLSDNAISCLFEDHAGFLWVGTENGLDRYDGNAVIHVEGIHDHITGIVEDGKGILWATTKDHGLLSMDPRTRIIRRFQHRANDPTSIASDQLSALHELNDTTLLIGSRESTLLFMDTRTHRFTYWTDSLSLSPAHASAHPSERNGWCHAIVPLDRERLWIGFLNNHMTLIADRRTGRITHRLTVERAGSESQTTALLVNNVLYNGGWQNGIDVMPMSGSVAVGPGPFMVPTVLGVPDEVLSLVRWNDGRIIAGTRQTGIFVIDPSSGQQTRCARMRADPTSLRSDRVRCALVDRSGTLWVGTADGLSYHVPSVWRMRVRALFDDALMDGPDLTFHRIEPTPDGGLRVFTSGGFFLVDEQLRGIRHEVVDHQGIALQPTVMARDHADGVMIGTEYGVLRYNAAKKDPFTVFEPSHGNAQAYRVGGMFQVRGIWPDTLEGRPVFIIGTLGFGVQVVDANSALILGAGMPKAATSVTTRNLVNAMARDSQGRYWCATSGGLYSWDTGMPLETLPPAHGAGTYAEGIIAPQEDVRHLVIRGDTLWAVTRGGTLLRVVGGSPRSFVPADGVRRSMYGLALDHDSRIWITTDDGLLRFDPWDTSFVHIPVNDGRDFRKLTRAITTLPDGRVAFCADNSLLVFDPAVYGTWPPLPPVYITSVMSAGKPVNLQEGRVRLTYRASVLDIGISALWMRGPQPLTFEYRLDGVETGWRTTSAREPIRYAGIPVGEHRLLVRTRDVFGRSGAQLAVLEISVSGPIWQQWWFSVTALFSVATALYGLYRYRLAQAVKLQAVRNRIASDLHDEVGSSLSSITIGSQLAARLSPEASDQVKALLTRMGETSSQSLRSISDIVWAIDPKNDEGEALVKRMRRIAQELLESKGVDVVFDVGAGVQDLRLAMNARKEILLIYKEAVHNASKYSGAERVQVSLHRRNGSLSVSVKDDGKGFDVSLHPDGHGLGSMRRRAGSIGAAFTLNSMPGLGTLVEVEVDLTRIRD